MILNNTKRLTKFYDDRYAKDYMEDWPLWKRKRVFEIIRSFHLPKHGKALDFGCGNGVFTVVVKQALPGWTVYGTDISTVAINNAKRNNTQCIFYNLSDKKYINNKYDFIFTHHVLEHVYDISRTWKQINGLTKKKTGILHILPCGNKGSFEHKICSLRKNGINKSNGRFFFEDKDHLRRLDAEKMNLLAGKNKFILKKQFYSNQFYGSLKFISSQNYKFILDFTNSSKVVSIKAKLKLYIFRIQLIFLSFCKKHAFSLNSLDYKKRGIKIMRTLIFIPFSLAARLIDCYFDYKAKQEWEIRKGDKAGSEMYLYYVKNYLEK